MLPELNGPTYKIWKIKFTPIGQALVGYVIVVLLFGVMLWYLEIK